MLADVNHTGSLKASRSKVPIQFRRMVGWFIIGLVIASLLVGLIWNHYQVRYPGADYQSTNEFQMTFEYQTPDELPKVLRWYTQHYALSHEWPRGDNCVMLAGEDDYLFLQGSLTVTLCAHKTRTIIFVDRSLALR